MPSMGGKKKSVTFKALCRALPAWGVEGREEASSVVRLRRVRSIEEASDVTCGWGIPWGVRVPGCSLSGLSSRLARSRAASRAGVRRLSPRAVCDSARLAQLSRSSDSGAPTRLASVCHLCSYPRRMAERLLAGKLSH